ncbi:hypothetical protein [Hirschia maritima]|uniref:hypothetical protein n=1 Tax=Hirschia maritima TaxID=1121961 RepID=UPI00037549BF|nr:hypothetical protein [Hirschia maritima]
MSERDALNQAIKDGVLTAEQGEKLQGYLAKGGDPYGPEDAENLSFLASFNDIFLTFGIMILMSGATLFLGWTLKSIMPWTLLGPVLALVMASLAWLMAEYFATRRRLLLPSMGLALVFYFMVGSGVGALLTKLLLDNAGDVMLQAAQNGKQQEDIPEIMFGKMFDNGYLSIIAGSVAALAFYIRFRLPFALFLIAVSGALLFYTFTFQNNGFNLSAIGAGAVFFVGLVTLAFAMFFDARDPARRTIQSDNAFWLHLAAAPQIMLGMRFMIIGDSVESESGSSVMMLIALLGVGILSLALNRRALIFSGLITFTLVVFSLVGNSGLSGVEVVALPLLIVGGSVVLLGAGWKTARNMVLKFFPEDGIWGRLFPPEHVLSGKNK